MKSLNTKFITRLLSAALLAAMFFVASLSVVSAQGGTGNPGGGGTGNPVSVPIKLDNPFKVGNDLFTLVQAIVNNVVLPIGGVLVVLAFIYSGFKYVTAQGNASKIEEANRALLYSAIGTAVLLGSWIIATVVKNTVNGLLAP